MSTEMAVAVKGNGVLSMNHMRSQPFILGPALAALTCAILAGCTAGATSSTARLATFSPSPSLASSPRATARIGSPANPLLLACGQESFLDPPVAQQSQPGDLVIGPLFIVSGKRLATANPADWGDHGSYKLPLVLTPGSTATVTIAVQARGQVVISNPDSPVGGVVAASYHSCSHTPGFFAQGFAFTGGQTRGCVPLNVSIDHEPRVRHVTISLFAGSCPS
jgi:hypothetical protein